MSGDLFSRKLVWASTASQGVCVRWLCGNQPPPPEETCHYLFDASVLRRVFLFEKWNISRGTVWVESDCPLCNLWR
ncbi:hypothetical protein BSKO_09525 [Bryopsis sp. KO-2023]|nr:hypothetical protein BSKO_09525 [Bryopsis sp. KO-2023]